MVGLGKALAGLQQHCGGTKSIVTWASAAYGESQHRCMKQLRQLGRRQVGFRATQQLGRY